MSRILLVNFFFQLSFNKVLRIFLLVFIFVTAPNFGRAANVTSLKNPPSRLEMQNPSTTTEFQKKGALGFTFESMSYLTQLPGRPELNNSGNSFVDFEGEVRKGSLLFKVLGRSGYSSESNSAYTVGQELYAQNQFEGYSLSIGRKFADWSLLDQNWKLGQWESKYNVDPLRPLRQGLSGVFLEGGRKNIKYTLFMSPFYMPTLSPEIKEQGGGDLMVTSRWAQDPSAEFPLQGKSTQILYSLEVPELEKIVKQPSTGAHLIIGETNEGPWWNNSFSKKPINDLSVAYKGVLKVKPDGTFGDVTIKPRVVQHEIYSSDLGYSFEGGSLMMSYLRDAPENENPGLGWNYQYIENLEILSAQVKMNIYEVSGEKATFAISRMKASGGNTLDLDGEGHKDKTRFSPRVIFKDAFAFDFQGPLYRKGTRRVYSLLRMVHDFDQQGGLFNAGFQFEPNLSWKMALGADILGVNNDSNSNQSTGFLNQNRANDRVYLGATYVY